MSNKQVVIETLQKKREELFQEREKLWAEMTANIKEIDLALAELLDELYPKDPEYKAIYDDENPNYIKASQEEM